MSGRIEESAVIGLVVSPESLRPLIATVVSEAIRSMESDRQTMEAGRLAYSEAEAAGLMGMRVHQLRDERLRGRIAASQIVGNRVRYTQRDLLDYLAARRINEGLQRRAA